IPNSVTSIGSSAFQDCSGLTSVTIPNSVTSIGSGAFAYCPGLTSVIIPPSVTAIGNDAFTGCRGLKKSAYPNTLREPFLSGIKVAYNPEGAIVEDGWIYGPEKKEIIFAPFSFIGDYTVPETIESIGSSAFAGCSDLTSVIIPGSVTKIGDNAFNGCSGLIKLAYPNTYTLRNYFFSNGGINGIKVAYNPEGAIIEDGWIYGPEKKEILFAPWSLEGEYTISETVESIGSSAFDGCSELTTIEVKNPVPPTFDVSSFNGLYDSVEVTIPQESAELYLSSDWTRFKNLRVSGSGAQVISADDGTLNYYLIPAAGADDKNRAVVKAGNYSGEVTIPERFTYTDSEGNNTRYYVSGIGYQAFKNSSITKVNFNSRIDLKTIGDEAFSGCNELTAFEIPNTVETIGSSAFENCGALTQIEIPNSVISIGSGAFRDCRGLTSLTIPESVTSIGASAFYGCSGLDSITIGNKVETIGANAFKNCDGLDSVTIGNSVTSIGESAFDGCSSLTKAEFASIEHLCSISFGDNSSNPLRYAHNLYINGENITEVIIPESVTSIGFSTFFGCSSLTSVEIPNSVTSIGSCAFFGCGLTSLEIPNSVTSIKAHAFRQCGDLYSVVIPNSVTSIGVCAFAECNWLHYVVIGNSVTSIGEEAFNDFNLRSITFNESSNPIEFGKNAFPMNKVTSLYWGRPIGELSFSFSNIEDLTIGNVATSIPDNKFKGLKSLKTLKLGNNITEIGANAFSGCTALTEVVVPASVETIGESAFAGNSEMKTIIMGANVKSIGDNAFKDCPAENVYITAQTPPEAPNTAFSTYTGKLWLQDPGDNSVIDAYYDAFTCWDRFDSFAMISATEIASDSEKVINGKPGDQIQLTATVAPADATLPQIFWRSTNPEVATVDVKGLVTILAASEDNARAAGEPCSIIAETLYDNCPMLVFNVNSEIVGIEEISVEPTQTEADGPMEVYNLRGVKVGTSVDGLAPGLYIVRQGSKTTKVAI
ncbi:MAG: leucine-rich repeat protein, partial [Muribaculaceae bacterium]|nr:leucine-rich repeat protein [Muribaculaceae bacterium]